MQRRCCLLLAMIFSFSALTVSAQTFTPQTNMAQEIFIRTTFVDAPSQAQVPNLKRLQVMAALQVMTFSDNQLHLSQYMTEDEVLRVLYHVAGVLEQAGQLVENDTYREELDLGERDEASHSDGLYLYALQNRLIPEEQFDAYYYTHALSRNTTALRYDVYLWMAKLFDIQPESDLEKLAKFSDGNRIKTEDKPYFAALVNHGLVMDRTALELYFPVSRDWFLNTLERMEPYFIEKMGYQKREGTVLEVTQEEGKRKIVVETVSQDQDVIEVPFSETQNQLSTDIAVLGTGGRQITACLTVGEAIWYYTIGSEVAFIVVQDALPKPLTNEEVEVAGDLYYYDPAMRMAVVQTDSDYIPVFLAENVSITVNTSVIAASDLCSYYGKEIRITSVMRYEHDLLTAKSCHIID